jgi:hypothetical protein
MFFVRIQRSEFVTHGHVVILLSQHDNANI